MLRANPKALVLSGISPAVTLQQSLLALQFSKLPYSCPNPGSEEVHLPPHQFPQSASVYLHKPETNLHLPLFAPSFPFSEVKDGNTCWHRYTSNILSPWMQQWAASFPSPNSWIQNWCGAWTDDLSLQNKLFIFPILFPVFRADMAQAQTELLSADTLRGSVWDLCLSSSWRD